ncbi:MULTISPECIES: MATE family efflux transporter [Psychrilyobacter]|uniref:Multidrug export protein MepA n=1 Tax=Psychrilyobacter piezotolerans TaxID=2293438 RepID=A0ABX9KFC7_9FUSO|nr:MULTISPECIES: MATE family efflux transporter [Psychrilyobacter]MCS5422158.1 MATE family efflux transporter [Psychrilyobacter sp. S5]NDI78520.1 MATE family efflux transporter [Psychrilyobacter piezotolerans]RDE60471.1 MATE family efflux transporter [Psychrilyobacter sp. S5]REI40501.1 MATE family efflux transporter [Psychrilyobacter piezotolerans]
MKNIRLESEKISKLLWEYSIPAITGTLVYILYNIVDRIFISFGVGRLAIAGISIALPLFTFILATGLFIGVGGGALISINLGKKDREKAEQILGNALTLFILTGILFSILGTLFLDDILLLFGATANNIDYAKDYMSIIFFATTFQLLFIGMNNIMRGEGNPKAAMKMSIIGCGLNILLDPLFIFTLDMGIKGAAMATVISNILVASLQIRHFLNGDSNIKLKLINLKLKKEILLGMAGIGIAPFIMQMSNSIVVIFINKNLNIYGGDIAIAAYGIINSISVLMYMPIVGIYQGSQPILGYNYGAKNYRRVRETYKLSLLVAISISAIGFILAIFMPHILISPFINNDKTLLDLTVNATKIFFSMTLFMGFHMIGSSYFQTVGKAKITTAINIIRQFILMLPLLYFLPKYYGVKGVWLAAPITDFTLAVITSYFVVREFKTLKRKSNLKREIVEI